MSLYNEREPSSGLRNPIKRFKVSWLRSGVRNEFRFYDTRLHIHLIFTPKQNSRFKKGNVFSKYTRSSGQSETMDVYQFSRACFSPLSTELFTKTNTCHQGTLLLSSLTMEKVVHKGRLVPTYSQIISVSSFYRISNC